MVAHRPLHRSGRAGFPHPAPTSGRTSTPRIVALTCTLSTLGTHGPALSPVRVMLERPSLGQPPSLHHLRSRARPALFGGFVGTMGPSDFSCSFITGVCPWTSRCGLLRNSLADKHEISRFPREVRPCMHGVSDRAGSRYNSPNRRGGHGLPLTHTASAPEAPVIADGELFSRLNTRPALPLSTLRLHPHECQRMTRGRRGWLALHRMALSSTTPHRF